MRRIRFFNTYEPVTDFYRQLLPELVQRRFAPVVYISRCEYRAGRDRIEHSLDGLPVKIRRLPAIGHVASSRFRRIMAAVIYWLSAAFTSLFDRPVLLNVFLTQPPLFNFWGIVLKLLRGQPYVCVLMDIYPDCIVAGAGNRSVSPTMRLLKWVSRKTWRSADGIVCIGRCMKDLVLAGGVESSKVVMIPNWADEKLIHPVHSAENPLRHDNGWTSDFIVLYSGNMGAAHMFDGVLQAAADLSDVPDIRFVFIGDGARRVEIDRFRKANHLQNLHLMPPQPPDRLAYSQSLGDVHFVCLQDVFTGLMVPSKAYSALAAGRPIIYVGSAEGEIARLVNEEGVGAVIGSQDHRAVKETILELYRDRDRLHSMGARANNTARGKYSARVAIARYADYFDELLTNPTDE